MRSILHSEPRLSHIHTGFRAVVRDIKNDWKRNIWFYLLCILIIVVAVLFEKVMVIPNVGVVFGASSVVLTMWIYHVNLVFSRGKVFYNKQQSSAL